MLIIKEVNYNKNYLTFQVLDKGTYLLGGTVIEALPGMYQMHLPYHVIRNLIPKQIQPFIHKEDNEIYTDDDLPVKKTKSKKPKVEKKVTKVTKPRKSRKKEA